MSKSKDKFITLKEAAEISGYAPDYVGQLIRGGKLEGKQVFSNVAWVTTEEAIREYMANSKKGSKVKKDIPASFSFGDIGKSQAYRRLVKVALHFLIGIGVLFALFLFYIMSVNLEDYLEKRAADKAVEKASTIQPQPIPDVPQLPL
jgi:hypothetical protein